MDVTNGSISVNVITDVVRWNTDNTKNNFINSGFVRNDDYVYALTFVNFTTTIKSIKIYKFPIV